MKGKAQRTPSQRKPRFISPTAHRLTSFHGDSPLYGLFAFGTYPPIALVLSEHHMGKCTDEKTDLLF